MWMLSAISSPVMFYSSSSVGRRVKSPYVRERAIKLMVERIGQGLLGLY
jgi:hypothetical protein